MDNFVTPTGDNRNTILDEPFDVASVPPLSYATPADAAVAYIIRGWTPLVVHGRGKNPVGAKGGGWRTITAEDYDQIERLFAGKNVGVLLGPQSCGLVDVDLDWPEAVVAARYLLPQRTAIFGRASSRESHRLYNLSEPYGHVGVINHASPFADPERKGNILEMRLGAGNKLTQSVFPGSTHESGELVEWERGCDVEPAVVAGEVLEEMCGHTAAASLLARHWPPAHHRHDLRLALAGMLYKTGFNLSYAKLFAEAVAAAVTCSAGASGEDRRDLIAATESTFKSAAEGRPFTAMQRIEQILGDEIGRALRNFMHYRENDGRETFDHGGERFDAETGEFVGGANAGPQGADAGPQGPGAQREQPKKEAEPPPPLVMIPFRQHIGTKIARRKFFVPGLIPTGVCTLLYGDGGLGKSTLMQMLQTALATRRKWLDVAIPDVRDFGGVKTLGVYCEDDETELLRRQERINDLYGIWDQSKEGAFDSMQAMSRVGESNFLMVFDKNGKGERTPFYDQLREKILDERINLPIFDPIVELFGGNEIVRPQVRQFMGSLNGLAREIDKLTGFGGVMLNGHPSAEGLRSGSGTAGSTDWSNAARARLYLEAITPDGNTAPDPDARVLSVKKANYSKRGERLDIRYRDGVFVVDEPDASAGVVEETDFAGETTTRRMTADEVFLDLLDEHTRRGVNLSASSHSGNFAPRVFGRSPERRGFKMADFSAAMSRLFNEGKIDVEAYGRKADERFRLARKDGADA